MVSAVRRGHSLRSVAQRFGVPLSTVQYWLAKAQDQRLDRVVFTDTPPGARRAVNRTDPTVEQLIVSIRQRLHRDSPLGEFGAAAIRAYLLEHADSLHRQITVPTERTINRILERSGVFDQRHRQRRVPPPRGWYLPPVAAQHVELDQFDAIESLVVKQGPQFDVLTAISLHGGLVNAWPTTALSARMVVAALIEHWQRFGLPEYAQFDNATIFQGPHQHRDVVSRVMRLCLSLEITPVFAVPRETGFQASIESFNGRWQQSVWQRFTFDSLEQLTAQSELYLSAYRSRSTARRPSAPQRRVFPQGWTLDLQKHPCGQLIYLRRTDDRGTVELLGRRFTVADHWTHRLVRCEVRLDENRICCYGLRRREPLVHPLLAEIPFQLPKRSFQE